MMLKALPLATFCFVLLFLHNFARHICGLLCYLDDLTSLVFTVIKCFDWFLELLNFICYDNTVLFFLSEPTSRSEMISRICIKLNYGKSHE